MNQENEILKTWEGIENVAKEQDLFDSYCNARAKYKEGLTKCTKGQINRDEVETLYESERNAFSLYLRHRTIVKPTGDET